MVLLKNFGSHTTNSEPSVERKCDSTSQKSDTRQERTQRRRNRQSICNGKKQKDSRLKLIILEFAKKADFTYPATLRQSQIELSILEFAKKAEFTYPSQSLQSTLAIVF